MKDIAKAVFDIRAMSSRLDKVSALKANQNVPYFKETLKFIYNPYVRTGIGKQKLMKGVHNVARKISIPEMIDYFNHHQTGSDLDVVFAWSFINQYEDQTARELAMAVVTKDLQIGVTETTLNQVYGSDFIPKIGVMLGDKYKDCKSRVKPPFIVTEKLDGHRRIIVKDNGAISIYTRSGLPDSDLVEIEAEAAALPDNMMYDGECLAIGEFKDSIALRQATGSIMNRKGPKTGVTFNVFDAVPLDEFMEGKLVSGAAARKILLGAWFKDTSIKAITDAYEHYIESYGIDYDFKFIKVVPVLGVAWNEADVMAFAEPIWMRGYEGVMLNTFTGQYEIKRTKELLKVKHTETHVLQIVGVLGGEGKFSGVLGSLLLNYKGNEVGVGSGFDDVQRQQFWANPPVGKWAEIDDFGESTNLQGTVSLNCPIFKRIALEVE